MAILPMAAMGDHIMFWHSALSALNISAVLQWHFKTEKGSHGQFLTNWN